MKTPLNYACNTSNFVSFPLWSLVLLLPNISVMAFISSKIFSRPAAPSTHTVTRLTVLSVFSLVANAQRWFWQGQRSHSFYSLCCKQLCMLSFDQLAVIAAVLLSQGRSRWRSRTKYDAKQTWKLLRRPPPPSGSRAPAGSAAQKEGQGYRPPPCSCVSKLALWKEAPWLFLTFQNLLHIF